MKTTAGISRWSVVGLVKIRPTWDYELVFALRRSFGDSGLNYRLLGALRAMTYGSG